ncbi:hypothetical protein MWH28_06735 [Natroniella sulfidigena]|uniref:hypothetical protein n=1 Tax=Natroniella sulfidigena TaxID=723921 RepID=UPI00200B0E8F|nr:hypothetical protein [Natroniella sulfidigena]MCK8817068.1 hypothetical protein [Natroniella sulfidigena]
MDEQKFLIEKLNSLILGEMVTIAIQAGDECCRQTGMVCMVVNDEFVVLLTKKKNKVFIPTNKIVAVFSPDKPFPPEEGINLKVSSRVVTGVW